MNEKELVLLATKGGKKKKKKKKAAACSTFLVQADCEMENRGYRWMHLKRSFLFFKKLPDFIWRTSKCKPTLVCAAFPLLARYKAITNKQLSLKAT